MLNPRILPTSPCCQRTEFNGVETLVIETSSGQQITLQSSPGSLVLADGNGNSLRMDSSGISIVTAGKLTFSAAQVEWTTPQLVVNSPIATFSGLVQADTVTAATLVQSGGGNVW